jgi:hypothetical protein
LCRMQHLSWYVMIWSIVFLSHFVGFYCVGDTNSNCSPCKISHLFRLDGRYNNTDAKMANEFPRLHALKLHWNDLLNVNRTTFLSCAGCNGLQLILSLVNDSQCNGTKLDAIDEFNTLRVSFSSYFWWFYLTPSNTLAFIHVRIAVSWESRLTPRSLWLKVFLHNHRNRQVLLSLIALCWWVFSCFSYSPVILGDFISNR